MFRCLRVVAAALRHVGERPPRPAGELTFAQLLADGDRPADVALGLVEPAELSLGDSAFGERVAELPPRPSSVKISTPRLKYGSDCS